MGNMKPIDSAQVKEAMYDVLSPDTLGGEYMEVIGATCQNPNGYTSGSLFLAKDNGVQHLYKATAAIAFGATITLGTNCTYTNVSGELGGFSSQIQTLSQDVSSQNEALTNEVVTRATNGAHNLLPNNLQTQVTRGIQVTVSADGKISLDGTLESQGTANNGFVICESFSLKAGSYKLSGVPSGGGFNKYQIVLSIGTTTLATDTGSGAEFTLSSDTTGILCQLWCYRAYGDYDGLSIYPMIRRASDTDPTYQPYAMTNRTLTKRMSVGYMKVSLTANTTKTVSSDTDLVEGAKPSRPAFCWFTCVNFSANIDANVTINVDSGNIYIKSTATHTVGIRWLQFDPYI